MKRLNLRAEITALDFSWGTLRYYIFFIIPGALVSALALRLFLIPGQLVSGGVSGAAQIIDNYVNWPIGLMIFIGNVPLFILGYRFIWAACVLLCVPRLPSLLFRSSPMGLRRSFRQWV